MESEALVQVGILGPIQVIQDNGTTASLSLQLRRVLGLLVVGDGSPVSADRLAEYVAGGRSEGSAVRTAVSRLRKVLGERIAHQAGGYRIELGESELDASRFERLIEAARSELPDGRIRILVEALALWRGDAIGDLADEDWATPTANRLEAARSSAIEDLAQAYLDDGRPSDAIELLEIHVPKHPYRERPVGLMMSALAAAGRHVEALRAFRRFRVTLRDEAGLDPTSELRAIEQRVLEAGDYDESAADGQAPRDDGEGTTGNLPIATPKSFVARDRELDQITALLDDGRRLVTLIGVGGIGKTRLAIESARREGVSRAPDGCWLVELATLSDPASVPAAVAGSLAVAPPGSDDTLDYMIARLGQRKLLVVLDNCEHVVGAAAEIVRALLTSCPHIHVIATSREPLGVDGEWLVPVPPLDTGNARRLFDDRAAAVGASFADDPAQIRATDDLCRRLDGIPLAIELAASRARAFTPVELQSMLDERFRVLVGRSRLGTDRHRTMRAALDWSYDLCTPTEQSILVSVSVFPARFDLDDARAMARGVSVHDLDLVDSMPKLIDRSLIERTTAEDGTTRYHLLETVRAYGIDHLERMGLLEAARDRHAQYIARIVGRLSSSLLGPNESAVTRRLFEYWFDCGSAFEWSLATRQWERAATVMPASRFWFLGMITATDRPSAAHTAGRYALKQQKEAMIRQLRDAMAEAGASGPLYDEVCLRDGRWVAQVSVDEVNELAWHHLRSLDPIPDHRFGWPLAALMFLSSQDEADDLMRELDRLQAMPSAIRVAASWSVFRTVLTAGYVVDQERFRRFEQYAEDLDSRVAQRVVLELRGHVARVAGKFADASRLLSEALARLGDSGGPDDPWFLVVTSWWMIECRARAGEPVGLHKVGEIWEIVEQAELHLLRSRGAIVTAMVLAAMGETGLAARFAGWVRDHGPSGVFGVLGVGLVDFGLDDVPLRSVPDDLGNLLGELNTLAAQAPSASSPASTVEGRESTES